MQVTWRMLEVKNARAICSQCVKRKLLLSVQLRQPDFIFQVGSNLSLCWGGDGEQAATAAVPQRQCGRTALSSFFIFSVHGLPGKSWLHLTNLEKFLLGFVTGILDTCFNQQIRKTRQRKSLSGVLMKSSQSCKNFENKNQFSGNRINVLVCLAMCILQNFV